MRKKAIEQLAKRSREVRVRNTKRIDRRKYFGVKRQMKEYEKLILNNLYDEELFNNVVLESSKENLSDFFSQYLSVLSERFFDMRDEIDGFFNKSFERGSKRVQDRNGNPIRVDEVVDSRALEVLKQQQFTYLSNITEKQSEIVQSEIAKGITEGLSSEQVALNMQSKVESLTKARALTISRTELVKAHNEGQLNTMRSVGAEKYIYWTTGDKKVAEICRIHQGSRSNPNVYSLNQAGTTSNPLPVVNSHPNCRCTILIAD